MVKGRRRQLGKKKGMESVLELFQSKVLVSGEALDTSSTHPRYTLYKAKKEGYGSQEARRRAFIEEQKSRKKNFADLARKLADGSEMSEEDDSDEDMDECAGEDKNQRSKFRQGRYPYRKQLMLSEWLVDVPEDFQQNWLVAVVPIGKRSLVVSARRTTSTYARAGYHVRNFPSLLPGGSKRSQHTSRDYCILDCVFHEPSQSYYMLDIMCWAGYPVYDSDSEFRLFWKEQKLKECPGAGTYSRINPLPFINLPFHPCTKESLSQLLSEPPPFEVDGLLFIHKECRYILGRTPLATWLKPHMVKDILGLEVSKSFLERSPAMESSKKPMVKMEVAKEDAEDSKKVVKMEVPESNKGSASTNGGTREGKAKQEAMEA